MAGDMLAILRRALDTLGPDDEGKPRVCVSPATMRSLLAVAEAADKLRKARDERHQRAADLQALAAKARAGGPSGQGVLNEYDRTHPVVWDIGDVTEEICAALSRLSQSEVRVRAYVPECPSRSRQRRKESGR